MKREEIEAILNDAELDTAAKVDAILNKRGAEVSAEKTRYQALETKYNDAVTAAESYKDYDALKTEVETLRAEKADREMGDRFSTVVDGKKFVNTYTADGVRKAFIDALALPENEGKTDAEVYASISADGKDAGWYAGTVKFSTTPPSGQVKTPTSFEAYIDELYATTKK
jgi:hypothetical protein